MSSCRILLRQDNADFRLTERAYRIGLATEERYSQMVGKRAQAEELSERCWSENLRADIVNDYLASCGSAALSESKKIADLAARPEVKLDTEIKYKGYIEREKDIAEKIARLEDLKIPEGFDFEKVSGLTIECRQKLKRYNPRTIAQASRISGVSPSDISVLLVYFGR